jgi:cation:H+ antiporter
MVTTILFFIGFGLLIKGASLLVDGASSLAKRVGISTLVIGLTIVSFGTSAPELVVNIASSLGGNTDLAIGNIFGSNIVNILFILGISAAIYPLKVGLGTVWKEIPFALLAVIIVGLLVNDIAIDGATSSVLSRIDGFILIGFFVIFLYYIYGISKSGGQTNEEEIPSLTITRSTSMVIAGIAGLVIGGKWIVDGAVVFATTLGVSEALIGLTIVAIGTSLPELATSAVAAYKKNVDIAVGNVVGSNIFNIFWILGLSAVVSPLPFGNALNTDLVVMIVATLLLFGTLFVGQKHVIDRWQGVVFIGLYIAYIVFAVLRG